MKCRLTIALVAGLLLACSCNRLDTATFTGDGDVRLEVGGKTVFLYDPVTCQLSSSSSGMKFRAQTDNSSDYFIVNLDELPTTAGQKMKAVVRWTSDEGLSEKNDVTLEVLKLEGDTVWMWSKTSGVAVVLRILI